MKVLIIIPAFPINLENIKGGVNSALSNLLKGFASANIDVRIVSFNREISELLKISYSPNIDIYYTPEGKMPHVFNFLFKGSKSIKKHIQEFNPTIVHYAMSGYILMTKVFGLLNKVDVVTIHGVPFREAKTKINLKEKLVYYTNGIVERLLCPKNVIHISSYSHALYSNRSTDHFTIIPNAIGLEYFKMPLKKGTSNKLIYIGTIEARKNILFILKTLKVLNNKGVFFSLTVLGGFTDDTYKNEVIEFINENHLQEFVTFYGWQEQVKLLEILRQSDILILSSKQETLPMVIAEAMSAGKVVVSSNVGGIPEMIKNDEDGFLFDNSSTDNLIPILERLYNNDVLVEKIQLQARNRAMETYNCERVANKTLSFYKLVTQSNF